LTIPFEPVAFGIKLNIHLLFEYFAFFIAFRYYLLIRRKSEDAISGKNRLTIILGAIVGALIGSRLIGFLENPVCPIGLKNMFELMNTKSIMGGLFGGLIGVEFSKKIIKEKESSGDLFTLPIILGIFIGRIGCFLAGTNEFTYGIETNSFVGMNLGDGVMRHPTSLYELIFLVILFICLRQTASYIKTEKGLLFKIFMISYFGFRLMIEFIKPNVFHILGLSSIQWLCIACLIYYFATFKKIFRYAGQKIHLL
jgi:phosphatidylglycerol:prolipoprotein diacylglycerol transferase